MKFIISRPLLTVILVVPARTALQFLKNVCMYEQSIFGKHLLIYHQHHLYHSHSLAGMMTLKLESLSAYLVDIAGLQDSGWVSRSMCTLSTNTLLPNHSPFRTLMKAAQVLCI